MSSRSKARRAASEADRDLHLHLANAERALVQAQSVVDRVARDRSPDVRNMSKKAVSILRELGQAQAVLRKVGLMGEPEKAKPREPSRAEKQREDRKKARQSARKTEEIARRLLASLEVDGGS